MPDVRIIGKHMVCPEFGVAEAASLWADCVRDGSIRTLLRLPNLIPRSLLGWTGDFNPEERQFSYIAGVMTRAGTPVPAGFAHRDLPASLLAKGVPGSRFALLEALRRLGYAQTDAPPLWNAELYFYDEPEREKGSWLTPVRKA